MWNMEILMVKMGLLRPPTEVAAAARVARTGLVRLGPSSNEDVHTDDGG
jgi:hypothetical protein